MIRSVLAPTLCASIVCIWASCTVYEERPAHSPSGGTPPAPGTPTYATATPTAPTAATPPASPTPSPTATPIPTPATTTPPAGMPTFPPPMIPGGAGTPTGSPASPGLPGGFTFPNVCIPIGTWTKKFDNGVPASGTVSIGTPILFNQFPVTDAVVIVSAPVGTLKGTGGMTSTNDLSVEVTNGMGYVLGYTCKFGGAGCNEGTCTTTKGGVGGFKLVKK